MATMRLSLPDMMMDWVEGLVRQGRYDSTDQYVCELVRRDMERAEKIAALQRLIEEGEASGVSSSTPEEILSAARGRAGIDDRSE